MHNVEKGTLLQIMLGLDCIFELFAQGLQGLLQNISKRKGPDQNLAHAQATIGLRCSPMK